MIGTLLGIGSAATFIGTAWTGEILDESPLTLLLLAAAALVIGVVFGALLVFTVGAAAIGWSVGAGVAAGIVLLKGQFSYVLPLLANAVVGWVVQAIQDARLRGSAGA